MTDNIRRKTLSQTIRRVDFKDEQTVDLAVDDPHGATSERYRSLVEDTSDGFYAFDLASGHFVFLNRRSCDLLGYTRQEASKIRIWDIVVPSERESFGAYRDDLLAGEMLRPQQRVFTLLRRDLTTFRAEFSAAVVNFQKRRVVQGIIRDITDYERFQARIDHFQRLETIASMFGGISQQLGNAVEVIQGSLLALEARFTELKENDVHKYLAQIKGAGHRIVQISEQLTAFAHGGESNPVPIDLNQFLDDMLPIIRRGSRPAIYFALDAAADLPKVKADAAQLQMVLMAIVANAEEAITERGRVRITTQQVQCDPKFLDFHPDLVSGPYVCLGVTDNGEGMDERTRRRVCEPFFTTKFQGRGLGMAAVYGIVKKHGGWLSIHSEAGKGTSVKVYLPAAE